MPRVEVVGDSMLPALESGDRLWVFGRLGPRAGDIVAVVDPRDPARVIVKRCQRVDPSTGDLVVVGDNPDGSTDSREFGPVPLSRYRGRAIYRYHPTSRAGSLRRTA